MIKINDYIKRNFIFKIILILIIFISLKFYYDNNKFNLTHNKNDLASKEKVKIKIFDLNKPLEPKDVYNPIKCRKSAPFYVTTTLCIHDIEKDIFVSDSIWKNGVWEADLVKIFTDFINQNPDWLIFDVGAQIGQYSLYAAKMDRHVITVEPFYDNVIRIHKASVSENLQNKITLIQNAISNKRNEIKSLIPNPKNIGGQSLDRNNQTYAKESSNKYLVETILFDDIINYLPKNKENKDYEKAIMKIDIEGSEPFAFVHAKKLFDKLDFQIIFMEWGNLPQQTENHQLILDMMTFLYDKNFKAYRNDNELNRADWLKWPMDIIWKKNIS